MLRILLAAVIFLLLAVPASSEPTQPVMPKIQETPMPPPVELPLPDDLSDDISNKPLTVTEAVEIALRRQPDITSARAGLSAVQGREKQVRSGLFPTLGLSSNYNRTDKNAGSSGQTGSGISTSNSTGYQASAAVRQLIFDFNHTRDLVKQAQAMERSAGANLSRVQSDLILQVKQAFYSLTQNERLVEVNEANLRNRQSHLDMAKARLKAGVGLPADVVRAETAVAEAALNLNLARTNAMLGRMKLAQLMGIDPRTPIKNASSEEPAVASDDLNALIDQAMKQRPEMAQAQARLDAAGHGINAASTLSMPSISANAGYYQRGASLPLRDNSTQVGISIQFSPFDSGFTAGRIQEAAANLESSQSDLESTRLSVLTEVSQSYLNMKTAEQRVVTADAGVANAEESLRLSQGRYTSGLGTFLDVLDAQTALLTANTNRINSQAAVQQARASLRYAVGERDGE